MTKLFLGLLGCVFLVACSAPTATRPPPTATPTIVPATSTTAATAAPALDSKELASRLDKFFGDLVKTNFFSGIVYITENGHVLYEKGFGTTKQPPNAPLTSTDKFRIGSITKNFTAAAILALQARGKLNVQDSVCKYLAECPSEWQAVTLHHLLTHTAGIPEAQNLELYRPQTPQEMAAKIVKNPLRFDPGSAFEYSNEGYIVLGAVIEKASGETFEEYLRETLWTPLGMNDTGVAIEASELAGYPLRQDFTNLGGGGSMYSTVQDLIRWENALDEWERDSDSIYQPMFQPLVDTPFPDESYGYGMWLLNSDASRFVYHTSAVPGYGGIAGRIPDRGLTVIVLSNSGYTPSATDLLTLLTGNR